MKKIIGIIEEVQVRTADGKTVSVMAKIDTGAHDCSVSIELARQVLPIKSKFLQYKHYASALGHQRRLVYPLTLIMRGEKIHVEATVSRRSHLTLPMLIGVRALQRFLVDPSMPHDILHKKTKPCYEK